MTDIAEPSEQPAEEVPVEEGTETPTEEVPVEPVELTPEQQDIQQRIAEVAALIEQEREVIAQAEAAEDAKNSAMSLAKAECTALCGPISDALGKATDPRERSQLSALEQEIHAGHADRLEAAYLTFAGQREGDSNPAKPGGVTQLGANAHVMTDNSNDVDPVLLLPS